MGDTCSKDIQSDKKRQLLNQRNTAMQQSVAIAYQDGQFQIPKNIPFQKQSTFIKIQKAAFSFCQQNNIDLDFLPCITRIIAYRQDKIFLTTFNHVPKQQRQNFINQISKIPQDQIDLFYHNFVTDTKRKYSLNQGNMQKVSYKIPPFLDTIKIKIEQRGKLQQIGREMLIKGQVGLVLMLAGSSSRFGHAKFLQPLSLSCCPKLTLLDILFLRIMQFSSQSPPLIIISTSSSNNHQIRQYLKKRNYYQINLDRFRFVQVEELPVLDLDGKYCVGGDFKLIKRPFGTARTLIQIMKENGILQRLNQQPIKYLHFVGAQNLFQKPLDPIQLAIIKNQQLTIVAKCVNSANQWQKSARYVTSKMDDKTYLKLPGELSPQITSQQTLSQIHKYPIPTNSLIISLSYLLIIKKDFQSDIYLSQNYHILRRLQKIIDSSTGKPIQKQCLVFEADLRDLLACSTKTKLMLVQRENQYVSIITKDKEFGMKAVIECYGKEIQEEIKHIDNIQKYIKFIK